MAHDATRVLLGATRSSNKSVTSRVGTVEAAVACRLKSDGTVSTSKADGSLLGISLGKDLANAGQISICRSGLKVPIQLTDSFTPTKGAQVCIDDVTGLAKAAGSGVTGVNAVYSDEVALTGVKEDGTECAVALIDMQGGL